MRCGDDTLEPGKDCRVIYYNNTEPGEAYAAVFGIGRYCGMSLQTFTISEQE